LLELTSPFDKIRSSFIQDLLRVNAIQFDKGENKLTFGTVLDNGFTEWEFSDDNELLGLYGRMGNDHITQLGLITLNKDCFIQEVVEPEEVVVVPDELSAWGKFSTWFSEIGIVKRISAGSIVLKVTITAATIIIIVVSILLCFVCHLKAKQGKNVVVKEDIEKENKTKADRQLQKKIKKSATLKQAQRMNAGLQLEDFDAYESNDQERTRKPKVKRSTTQGDRKKMIRDQVTNATDIYGNASGGWSIEVKPTPGKTNDMYKYQS